MCNAFSCVVLRDGYVKWEVGVDSHDRLISLMAHDMGVDQRAIDGMYGEHFMARVEMHPDVSYLQPDDEWHVEFDAGQKPDWWGWDHNKAVDRAFGLWKSDVYSKINLRRLRAAPRVMELLHMQRDQCLMHAAEQFLDMWVNGLWQYRCISLSALEVYCNQKLGRSLSHAVMSCAPDMLGLSLDWAPISFADPRNLTCKHEVRQQLLAVRQAYTLAMMMPCVPNDCQDMVEAGARLVELGMVPLCDTETGEWTLVNAAGTYFSKAYKPLDWYGNPPLTSLLPAFDSDQQINQAMCNWVKQAGAGLKQAQYLPCQSTMDVAHTAFEFAKTRLGRW